jgi:hypothetical protein
LHISPSNQTFAQFRTVPFAGRNLADWEPEPIYALPAETGNTTDEYKEREEDTYRCVLFLYIVYNTLIKHADN